MPFTLIPKNIGNRGKAMDAPLDAASGETPHTLDEEHTNVQATD